MKNFFIKAIQTRYHGCHFRSRLEARWAVFFDTLGVQWEYEKEGYTLEGINYLPDFWLPQQDCFVEIKGEEPTEEEREKAGLLCLYTGKYVHTLSGIIDHPDTKHSYEMYTDMPARLFQFPEGGMLGDSPTTEINAPPIVRAIAQKLYECNILLNVRRQNVCLSTNEDIWHHDAQDALENYLITLQEQQETVTRLTPLILENYAAILQSFTHEPGWTIELFEQSEEQGGLWEICSVCDYLDFHFSKARDVHHKECKHTPQGVYLYDAPRLMEAYNAARSARF